MRAAREEKTEERAHMHARAGMTMKENGKTERDKGYLVASHMLS